MALTNVEYNALPKLANIQGFWQLEEASGNRVDLSDNANTLTDNNTVTNGAAKIGNGASFASATTEYLSRAAASCVGINNSTFTLLAWVKVALGTVRTIVGGSATYNRQWRVEIDGKLMLIKNNAVNVGSSTGTIGDNILTHVAISYDGTNYAHYINGALSGSGANAQTLGYGDYRVGRDNGTEYMNGIVDELIVYNALLTAGEVAQIYAIITQAMYRLQGGSFLLNFI